MLSRQFEIERKKLSESFKKKNKGTVSRKNLIHAPTHFHRSSLETEIEKKI